MAWMKSWGMKHTGIWHGWSAGGQEEVLEEWMKSWGVGGGVGGVDEELGAGRGVGGVDGELWGGRRCWLHR